MNSKNHILKDSRFYPEMPDWQKKVYMPVSMNNGILKDEEALAEILGWIFEKTGELTAVIGDYLHRHNIMIDGTGEKQAISKSINIGLEYEKLLKKSMLLFPDKSLKIKHTRSFYTMVAFTSKLAYFNGLYENNIDFRREIDFLIHQFLERQGNIDWCSERISHCREYLLEELVIFEMLAVERFLINVYPGKQLRVFKNIVTGKLRGISNLLEQVSLVEMRFRPARVADNIKRITGTKK